MDDSGIVDFGVRDIFAECFARNGEAIEVEQFWNFAYFFQYCADAACGINVLDVELTRWRDLADIGASGGDFVYAVEVIFDTRLACDCQRMQDGICRAAHCHIERKGVIHRFGADYVQRLDVFFNQGE